MITKAPTRIMELVKCQLSGHAHCKSVSHRTPTGVVIDCIVHHIRGRRTIENIPKERMV